MLKLPGEKLDLWKLGDWVKKEIENERIKRIMIVKGCGTMCSAAIDKTGLPEDIKFINSDKFPEDHEIDPKHIGEQPGPDPLPEYDKPMGE